MTRARNVAKTFSGQQISGNLNLSGIVTATTFHGEGSGITGITAVGAGVTLLDNNANRGAASKINFADGISVSVISSGIATVTGLSTSSVNAADLNVSGMATIGSNISVSGIATASQFNGPLTGVAVTATGQSNLANVNVSAAGTVATLTVSGQTTLANVNVSSGIATVAGQLTAGHVSAGVVTATTFIGDGTQLTGVGTAVVTTSTLDVTGVSTFRDNVNILDYLNVEGATELINTRITGITTLTKQLHTDNVNVSGFTTFIIGNYGSGKVVDFVSDQGNSGGGLSISHESGNPYGVFMRFHSHDNDLATITTDSNSNMVIDTGANLALRAGGIDLASGNALSTRLYCSDTEKLSTSQSGVTVTGGIVASGINTAGGINVSGIITSTGHVDTGITTYYGDSSYSAALRWSLMASGSDHYVFTGPGLGHSTSNDPTLYLKRGQTYMFENKMGAHPFRIQSTSNGATGTQWNVGVTNNDVSNGVLIFEVPFVTPDTLYYQCTAHANMGGVINIA